MKLQTPHRHPQNNNYETKLCCVGPLESEKGASGQYVEVSYNLITFVHRNNYAKVF